MGKALSGELSYTQTGLVWLMKISSFWNSESDQTEDDIVR